MLIMMFVLGCTYELINCYSFVETVKIESGQLIQCVVKGIDKTRSIIHLSSDEDLISKSIVRLSIISQWLLSLFCIMSVITNL